MSSNARWGSGFTALTQAQCVCDRVCTLLVGGGWRLVMNVWSQLTHSFLRASPPPSRRLTCLPYSLCLSLTGRLTDWNGTSILGLNIGLNMLCLGGGLMRRLQDSLFTCGTANGDQSKMDAASLAKSLLVWTQESAGMDSKVSWYRLQLTHDSPAPRLPK